MDTQRGTAPFDRQPQPALAPEASLPIDTRVYPLDDIARAAYRFTDRLWIWFQRDDDHRIIVHLRSKSGVNSPDVLLGEFANALLDEMVRRSVASETAMIRDTLIRAALAEACPKSSEPLGTTPPDARDARGPL